MKQDFEDATLVFCVLYGASVNNNIAIIWSVL